MIQEPHQTQQPDPSQDPFGENNILIMDILLTLARHLKLIIITPAIFCIVTIIYLLCLTKPVYISTATFMSSGSGGEQSQIRGLASQFGFLMPNSSTKTQWSYKEIIKSRTMAKALLKYRFNTIEFGLQKELMQIVSYGNGKQEVGIDTLIKTSIGAVQNMIMISKSGSMYKLEISTFDPQLSADLAIAVMEELDRHQREYNARKTTETRQFIEDRLISTKIELEDSEEALKDFRKQNRSILESPQLQMEQERLGRDVAVLIGVFTTLKQQLETAKIEEVKESDYIIILDSPEVPLHPVKPKKKRMVILAGFLGIGMGMLLALIKEFFLDTDNEEREKLGKIKSLVIKNMTDFLPNRFKKT